MHLLRFLLHNGCRSREARTDEPLFTPGGPDGHATTACSLTAESIYLGGGTPSVLLPCQLRAVLDCLHAHYPIAPDAEVTIEINPDDITSATAASQLLDFIARSPVNRVSLGIQTFSDTLLHHLHRRHDAAAAVSAVRALRDAGIGNVSIDLIYGLPGQTMDIWQHDLDTALSLGVQHLSAYALSYEPATELTRQREAGLISEASDDLCVAMYETLCRRASDAGFVHYEISNFALPGRHSRHNSSYWKAQPYMGFGPGAHSYDGRTLRRANLPDLRGYIGHYCPTPAQPIADAATAIAPPAASVASAESSMPAASVASVEVLDADALYDEAVMCGLRTAEGICLADMKARFGQSRLDYMLLMAQPHLRASRLHLSEGRLRLTPTALMVSDCVMADLMAV